VVMSVIGGTFRQRRSWTAHYFRTFATSRAIGGEPPRMTSRAVLRDGLHLGLD